MNPWLTRRQQGSLSLITWDLARVPNLQAILNGRSECLAWLPKKDAVPYGSDLYWGVVRIVKDTYANTREVSARMAPVPESTVEKGGFSREYLGLRHRYLSVGWYQS
jgi:hypothetical protein